jgi:hypothetical protein
MCRLIAAICARVLIHKTHAVDSLLYIQSYLHLGQVVPSNPSVDQAIVRGWTATGDAAH